MVLRVLFVKFWPYTLLYFLVFLFEDRNGQVMMTLHQKLRFCWHYTRKLHCEYFHLIPNNIH